MLSCRKAPVALSWSAASGVSATKAYRSGVSHNGNIPVCGDAFQLTAGGFSALPGAKFTEQVDRVIEADDLSFAQQLGHLPRQKDLLTRVNLYRNMLLGYPLPQHMEDRIVIGGVVILIGAGKVAVRCADNADRSAGRGQTQHLQGFV